MSILSIALLTVVIVIFIVAIPIIILIAANNRLEKKDAKKVTATAVTDAQNETPLSHWVIYALSAMTSFDVIRKFVFVQNPIDIATGALGLSVWSIIEIVIAVVGIVLFIRTKYKKQKAGVNVFTRTAPQSSLIFDIRAWLVAGIGYVFFSMISNMMMFGPIHPINTLIDPPGSMMYLPLFGLFIVAFACAFILPMIIEGGILCGLSGIFLGIILLTMGFANDWFMPWDIFHNVNIPALNFIGLGGWVFQPDPLVPLLYVVFGSLIILALPYLKKNKIDVWFYQAIIGIILTVVFGQQLLYFLF